METVAQKPRGVSTYDWETGATTFDVTQMDSGTRFRCAISQATEAARKRFPHSNERIEKAYALVTESKVVLHPRDGTATVQASGDRKEGPASYTVNGVCSCPDAPTRAPEGYCKHRLAVVILRQALRLVAEWKNATAPVTVTVTALDTTTVEAVTVEPAAERLLTVHEADVGTLEIEPDAMDRLAPVVEAEVIPSTPRLPREFLYDNHGTPAILWGGLLHMAQQAGMYSMVVEVVTVSETFAVMRATARFHDGGIWSDIGDATPQNVGKKVAASFIRMASTRAQARCLRTALDIHYVAHCELPDSEDLAGD